MKVINPLYLKSSTFYQKRVKLAKLRLTYSRKICTKLCSEPNRLSKLCNEARQQGECLRKQLEKLTLDVNELKTRCYVAKVPNVDDQ